MSSPLGKCDTEDNPTVVRGKMAPCMRTDCGTCVHACTFERIYSSLNCDTCIFLWHSTEEAEADAEYTSAVNEIIGLEQTDDITPQAPLYTVSPIGNMHIAVDNIMFIFAII